MAGRLSWISPVLAWSLTQNHNDKLRLSGVLAGPPAMRCADKAEICSTPLPTLQRGLQGKRLHFYQGLLQVPPNAAGLEETGSRVELSNLVLLTLLLLKSLKNPQIPEASVGLVGLTDSPHTLDCSAESRPFTETNVSLCVVAGQPGGAAEVTLPGVTAAYCRGVGVAWILSASHPLLGHRDAIWLEKTAERA